MRRLALAALIALSPVGANAACVQSDLTGTWNAYISSQLGSFQAWERCTIDVAEDGSLDGVCANSEGSNGLAATGNVLMRSQGACVFDGNVTVGGGLRALSHGAMALDRTTAFGVGKRSGIGLTFVMVKR